MSIHEILANLDEYRSTREGFTHELLLSFSELIHRQLKTKHWTQRDLATAAGKKESFVSRVLQAEENCTFETAGALLHALGIRARLREHPQETWTAVYRMDGTKWNVQGNVADEEDASIQFEEKTTISGSFKLREIGIS